MTDHTTEPFADEHSIIEAAQTLIEAAQAQIYAALARIVKPPGTISRDYDDEWDYSDLAGAYARYLAMGRWVWTGMRPALAPKSNCWSGRPASCAIGASASTAVTSTR